MSNAAVGRAAEAVAARYLETKGYQIMERNWRTRWCEIDIVASRADMIYFCEVKYRSNSQQGAGLEYVTPRKLMQMSRAAEGWVQETDWAGEYSLCVLELAGPDPQVTAFRLDIQID